MKALEIMLERDTANDECAVVAVVLVPSGTPVVKDQPLFEIENSKATEEHVSPGNGILMHDLVAGQSVNFGVVIARILPLEEFAPLKNGAGTFTPPALPTVPVAIDPPKQMPATPAASSHLPRNSRFSIAASAMLLKHNLSAAQFDADFVTSRDVLAHLQCQDELLASLLPVAVQPRVLPHQSNTDLAQRPSAKVNPERLGSPIGQRKRAEIETLSHGAGETMLSVLGVTVGPLLVRRQPGDFLAGRITDLVLYESSRLMRKYPRLNSFYAEGQIFLHDDVHAGLAIDDGGRLMVYGIEHADRTGLPELAHGIADAVGRYVNGELTAQELTRATFTVTDLSAGELDFVLPLLPRGQSCILGITSSARTGFRLFAGFDHRVTEGREVMAFLGDLRDRLLSFSSAECTVVSASVCAFCARSSTEAVRSSKEKGLLRVVGRDGEEVLCCGSCWSGW